MDHDLDTKESSASQTWLMQTKFLCPVTKIQNGLSMKRPGLVLYKLFAQYKGIVANVALVVYV